MPTVACADPLTTYRRIVGPGTCLLESIGPQLPTTRRSLLALRALLRIEVRGGAIRLEALTEDAQSLTRDLRAYLGEAAPGAQLGSPRDKPLTDAQKLASPSFLDALRHAANLIVDSPANMSILSAGLFGALSYEAVDLFEDLPARRPDPLDEADASFVLVADMIVFDHDRGQVQIVTRALPGEEQGSASERHRHACAALRPAEPRGKNAPHSRRGQAVRGGKLEAQLDMSDEDYLARVEQLQTHIADGDIFQAVLSRGIAVRSPAASLDVYAALRRDNPSPYMFHFDLGDGALLGASPETFLRVEDAQIEIRPIAGTVSRGLHADGSIDKDVDQRLALQLLLDPKEQAEHVMLLDLARNDVARVSRPGSTRVVQQFAIEAYSHVQHMVSRVRGTLREGLDALHAWRAVANMGTLSGAPKLRAMELIREYETQARGYYGGAAGYLLQDGSFDSCIVIRSLRQKDGVYYTRAGAGIVADSVPAHELAETGHKARACLDALTRVSP